MKQIIVFLVLLSVCFAGHIYVGDVSLEYQNVGDFGGFRLAIMLESGISATDCIQVTWPFDMTASSSDGANYLKRADGTTIALTRKAAPGSNSFALQPATAVDANTWFELKVTGSGTPTAQLYTKPITIMTVSAPSSTAGYITYDENPSAGLVSVVAAPVTVADVQVTTDQTKQVDVSATDANKVLGAAAYTVYIDFKPLGDYTKGANVIYTLSQKHTFAAGCTVLDNSCPVATADTSCRNTTKAGGSCAVDSTNSQVIRATFSSIRKSTDTAITYYRIQVSVQNPVFYIAAAAAVSLSIESKFVKRKYETFTGSASIFQLNTLTITDKKFTLFWGMMLDSANAIASPGWGCPIAVYKQSTFVGLTPTLVVWNKFTFYFSTPAFPTTSSNAVYTLQMKLGQSGATPKVALSSLATNLPTFPSGSKLACTIPSAAVESNVVLECTNVGSLSAGTSWIAISVSYAGTATAAFLANLGGVKITQSSVTAGVSDGLTYGITGGFTTGSGPTADQLFENDEFNGAYSGATYADVAGLTQVVDLETAVVTSGGSATSNTAYAGYIKNAITQQTSLNGRSGIKLTSGNIDLAFLLSPTVTQLCSSSGTGTVAGTAFSLNSKVSAHVNTADTGNNYCGSTGLTNTSFLTQTVFHMIANPNIINIATPLNGIFIPPSQGFLATAAANWCATTDQCGQYAFANNQTASQTNSYANQVLAGGLNLWQKTTNGDSTNPSGSTATYWLLILTCASKNYATASATCSTTTTAVATDVYPSVVMPAMTFATGFKGNSLYPSANELDFIVCFRAYAIGNADNTGFVAVTQTTPTSYANHINSNTTLGALSSTGVIHAWVFQGALDSSTQFRLAFVNAIKGSSLVNSMKIAPILFRVSGILASADLNGASVSNIIVFFDQGLVFDATANVVVANPTTITTGSTTLTIALSQESQSGVTAAFNYYPVMQRYILNNAAVAAATDFNYYAVMPASGFLNLKAVNLVLAASTVNQNYGAGPAYNLYGSLWQKDQKSFIDGTLVAIADAADEIKNLNTPGTSFEISSACDATSNIFTDNSAVTSFYGGLSVANASLKLNAHGCAKTGALDVIRNAKLSTNTVGFSKSVGTSGWGLHFVIVAASTKKYWEGTVTNGFKNTNAPIFDCSEVSYKLASGDTFRTRFALVCPLDDATSAPDITSTTATNFVFTKFTIPTYQGGTIDGSAQLADQLKKRLGYIFTSNSGVPMFYYPQVGNVVTLTYTISNTLACSVTANSAVMSFGGNAQKVTFAFNPKLPFDIKYYTASSQTDSDSFEVVQTISSITSQTVYPTYCVSSGSLQCSLATSGGVNTFTLTAASLITDGATQTISAGDISINFWMSDSTTAATTATTHKAMIYQWNADADTPEFESTNDCSRTSDVAWNTAGNYSNSLSIPTVSIANKLISARTSFSISWSVSKPVWSFSSFDLTLGAVGAANTGANADNKRCRLYNTADGSLSFDFSTLTNDLSTTVNAQVKSLTQAQAFTYSKSAFTMKCFGVTMPSSTSAVDFIITHKTSETLATLNKSAVALSLASPVPVANVVLTSSLIFKSTTDAGAHASYVFNLKTTGNAVLPGGYYIIVEFSQQVAPKLNRQGMLYCEQGYNTTISQAYCSLDNDRRVRIFASQTIDNGTYSNFNFTIHGVENAGTADTLKSIYFHIEQEDGTVIYRQSPDFVDDGIAATVNTAIPVLDFNVQGNVTRSTQTFMIDVSLLSTQVAANAEVHVQFDAAYISTFYKGFSPSCSLSKIFTPPGQTDFQIDSVNFAANCTFMQATRIKIFLNAADAKNVDSAMYRLQINGVPTPWAPSAILYQLSAPVVFLASTALTGVITSTTRTQAMNNTMYGVGNSAGIQLDWASVPVTASIGVYQSNSKAQLLPISDKYNLPMKQFSADTTFTVSNTAFSFAPTTFSVKQGDASLSFIIAPKATTSPGLYYLAFSISSSNSADYAPLKPLSVLAKNIKCAPVVQSTYTFPATIGGTSLPYVVDFSACQPESMVTLKIASQITNGTVTSTDGSVLFNGQWSTYSNQNSSFASPNFTFADGTSLMSQTVTYGSNTGFTFQLKNLNVVLDTGVTSKTVGNLLFAWDNSTSSVNYKSYSAIFSDGFASVSAVASNAWASMIKSNTDQPTLVPASATYSISCDQPAIVYFVASRNNVTVTSAAASDIKANTLSKNIMSTYPVGKDATIYGYVAGYTANTPVSVVLSPVRSQAQYFFKAICVNTAGTTADNSTYVGTFNASDNKGRPGIAKLTYQTALTTTQATASCAALSSFVQVPCNRTMCSDGKDACGNKFDPYGDFGASTTSSSTSSSTSTTTTNTTTSTNITNTNTTTNTTARRRVLQSTCNVTNCVTCTTGNASQCATCNQTLNLLRSPDASSCVATCSTNYQNVSGQCTFYQQTDQVVSVTPAAFAASDNTQSKVQTAVTTNKASLIAALSAATGVATSSIASDYIDTSNFGGVAVNVTGSVNATTTTSATIQFNMTTVSGFVIAGYGNSGSTVSSFSNLKLGVTNNGTLQGMFVKYAAFGKPIQNTWSGLTSGTEYAYIYGATDLDLVSGLTSGVSNGQTFKTQGTTPSTTPKGAMKITTTFFALLALLFVAFIMI